MTQASVLVFLGKTLQTLPVLVLRLPRNRQLSYGDGIGVCRNRWRARCREPEFKSQGGSVKLGGASVRFVSLLFDADLVRAGRQPRSEEHTSELQSPMYLVCRLLLEKKKKQWSTAE